MTQECQSHVLFSFPRRTILGPLPVQSRLVRAKKRVWRSMVGSPTGMSLDLKRKWIRGGTPGRLVNSLVAESLADLGFVREMRVVPFRREDVARLAGATAAPLLPLMVTIVSLEELLTRLARSFSDVLEQEGYVVRLRQRITSRLPRLNAM
jgi:hypothetical protein